MCYDKPFKDFDEQIQILKDRNLIIEDEDFAIKALQTLSYYDLINGYKECFTKDDEYDGETTFLDLYILHNFNRTFQNVLFKYTVYIETHFKTILAYVISKNYSVDENFYLNKNNFINPNKTEKKKILNATLKRVNNIFKNKNFEDIDEPTRHYKKCKNHIPPWILFKNIKFADAINIYSFLRGSDKEEVCNLILSHIDIPINDKKELLKNSLTIIRKFRNKIAHNLKFITYKTDKKYLNYDILKNTDYRLFLNFLPSLNVDYDNAYSMIISMFILISDNFLITQIACDIEYALSIFKQKALNQRIFEKFFSISEIPEDIQKIAYMFSFKDMFPTT